MTTMLLNNELKGVEIYFDSKPVQNIIDNLKNNGFRWHNLKKCWYAKQNEKTILIAQQYTGAETKVEHITEIKTVKKTAIKNNNKLSLWDRVQFTEGTVDTSKYKYKFVGSNYTGLTTKETAAEIRRHLKAQFPEVKFSVTSDYNRIDIVIKQSPYNWQQLEYSPDLAPYQYREYEKEHNKELIVIKEYCQKLLDSYNFDDSDSQSDYFNIHFYDSVSIAYDYNQTEQTEVIKADIIDFRNKLEEAAKAEEEKKEKEYQEYLKQKEEEEKQYKLRLEEEKRQIEVINNSVDITELEESKQYFIMNVQMANINKNCRLEQYKNYVAKGDFYLNNIKVTKEVHFKSEEALRYFENLLLNDFDFLAGTGGSYTNDKRINSMIDYYNMTKEEQETVIFNLYGVAIYYNNKLQFVIDAQGFSYARYVGLTDNATITKHDNIKPFINNEEIIEAKANAETLIDYSTEVITELNIVKTWNNESWKEYKEALKTRLKAQNYKLTKAIIQQIPEEHEALKVAMYKLLKEVDGIQEQFKNADIKQGQKITMFFITDFGGMATNKVTFDKVEYTSYAQYDNAVKVIYTPEQKRTQYYKYFYRDILIYNGWLDLPETVLHEIEYRNGITITKTKYGSCDNKQYDEILNYFAKQGIKPIINTYKPVF